MICSVKYIVSDQLLTVEQKIGNACSITTYINSRAFVNFQDVVRSQVDHSELGQSDLQSVFQWSSAIVHCHIHIKNGVIVHVDSTIDVCNCEGDGEMVKRFNKWLEARHGTKLNVICPSSHAYQISVQYPQKHFDCENFWGVGIDCVLFSLLTFISFLDKKFNCSQCTIM